MEFPNQKWWLTLELSNLDPDPGHLAKKTWVVVSKIFLKKNHMLKLWKHDPTWRAYCFKGVETTNYLNNVISFLALIWSSGYRCISDILYPQNLKKNPPITQNWGFGRCSRSTRRRIASGKRMPEDDGQKIGREFVLWNEQQSPHLIPLDTFESIIFVFPV